MLITLICCNYYNYLSNSLSSSLIDDLWLWEDLFARTDLPRSPASKALISATTRLGAISPSSPVRPKTVLELKLETKLRRTPALWQKFASLAQIQISHTFPMLICHCLNVTWTKQFQRYTKKNAAPQGPLLRASNFRTWASFTLFTFTWASTKLLHCGLASLSHICHITHHCTTFTQQSFKTLYIYIIYIPIESMVLLYMVTWIPSIYPKC